MSFIRGSICYLSPDVNAELIEWALQQNQHRREAVKAKGCERLEKSRAYFRQWQRDHRKTAQAEE